MAAEELVRSLDETVIALLIGPDSAASFATQATALTALTAVNLLERLPRRRLILAPDDASVDKHLPSVSGDLSPTLVGTFAGRAHRSRCSYGSGGRSA